MEAEPVGDRMRWRVAEVGEALGVPVPAGLDPVAGVAGGSIDSRSAQPGGLFIRIRGTRRDGQGFVAGALAGGAAAGVVASERAAEYAAEIREKLFVVDDTLDGLHRLASRACDRWRKGKPGRRIGGVAGGVGKNPNKQNSAGACGGAGRGLEW